MQDLYATRLVVHDADFASIESAICEWVCRRGKQLPEIDPAWTGRRSDEIAPGRVVTRERLVRDAVQGFSAVLRHPDDSDPTGLSWVTTVETTQDGVGPTFVTVRVTREATEHRVAPARFELRPPGIVLTLLRTMNCRDGNSPFPADAREIGADEVGDFIAQCVNDTGRRFPILLVAGPSQTETVLTDRLAGLAQVVYFDRPAWDRLNGDAPDLAPLWRGARLIWPLPWSPTLKHPSFVPSELKPAGAFHARVSKMLTRLSVARTPRDHTLVVLREHRMRTLADAALGKGLSEAEVWRKYAEELEAERARLRDDLDRLTSDMVQIYEDLEAAEARLSAQAQELEYYRAQRVDGDAADEVDTDLVELQVEDWAEFARKIHLLESDAIRFCDEAVTSLDSCEYPHPQRMWRFLAKLTQVAADYRLADGELGTRLKAYAQDKYGIEISLQDDSLGKYEVVYDGIALDAVPHVKVDDVKKPNECGRIHFALDTKRRRFVVAHIGLHR